MLRIETRPPEHGGCSGLLFCFSWGCVGAGVGPLPTRNGPLFPDCTVPDKHALLAASKEPSRSTKRGAGAQPLPGWRGSAPPGGVGAELPSRPGVSQAARKNIPKRKPEHPLCSGGLDHSANKEEHTNRKAGGRCLPSGCLRCKAYLIKPAPRLWRGMGCRGSPPAQPRLSRK